MTSKNFIAEDAIRKLAEILKDTDLSEIEYEENNRRIKVSRQNAYYNNHPHISTNYQPENKNVVADTKENFKKNDLTGIMKSPMVGTVYLAPEPGVANFVKVGDQVKAGQTIFIIEAMKVMNPIKSPKSGTVTRMFVQDGEPVEFDAHLLEIE